jgi:hypothetical protein
VLDGWCDGGFGGAIDRKHVLDPRFLVITAKEVGDWPDKGEEFLLVHDWPKLKRFCEVMQCVKS